MVLVCENERRLSHSPKTSQCGRTRHILADRDGLTTRILVCRAVLGLWDCNRDNRFCIPQGFRIRKSIDRLPAVRGRYRRRIYDRCSFRSYRRGYGSCLSPDRFCRFVRGLPPRALIHCPFFTSNNWPVEPYLNSPSGNPTAEPRGGQSGISCSDLSLISKVLL